MRRRKKKSQLLRLLQSFSRSKHYRRSQLPAAPTMTTPRYSAYDATDVGDAVICVFSFVARSAPDSNPREREWQRPRMTRVRENFV